MHLAQLNIAKAKYSLVSLEMKEIVDNLEPVNKLAESSLGVILMPASGFWLIYPTVVAIVLRNRKANVQL
ncbi:DUF3291 domain-containing protein [Colwellia sp. MSW7]|uniref:DUF3291 domain-containing protein n=1 Tax=Colwellia maritima TaxID=2912588 RepID=A0ABS9WY69_9GAMM|nr:DUF6463 family protein [Colwellia maritima]MCI2282462.1 DUF3291 domain-containing protein [Colwellia maritima]